MQSAYLQDWRFRDAMCLNELGTLTVDEPEPQQVVKREIIRGVLGRAGLRVYNPVRERGVFNFHQRGRAADPPFAGARGGCCGY